MEEGEPEKEEGKRGKEQRYVRRYLVTSVRLEKIPFQTDKLENLLPGFPSFRTGGPPRRLGLAAGSSFSHRKQRLSFRSFITAGSSSSAFRSVLRGLPALLIGRHQRRNFGRRRSRGRGRRRRSRRRSRRRRRRRRWGFAVGASGRRRRRRAAPLVILLGRRRPRRTR